MPAICRQPGPLPQGGARLFCCPEKEQPKKNGGFYHSAAPSWYNQNKSHPHPPPCTGGQGGTAHASYFPFRPSQTGLAADRLSALPGCLSVCRLGRRRQPARHGGLFRLRGFVSGAARGLFRPQFRPQGNGAGTAAHHSLRQRLSGGGLLLCGAAGAALAAAPGARRGGIGLCGPAVAGPPGHAPAFGPAKGDIGQSGPAVGRALSAVCPFDAGVLSDIAGDMPF